MSEYICKENLIKEIENDCPNLVYYSKKEAISCIESMSVADVKPVIHAKWVYDDNHHEYYCSNCEFSKEYVSPYCDYCGAKMDKE